MCSTLYFQVAYRVLTWRLSPCRSVLPVQPTAVGPAISLELDVDDGEVENYEVNDQSQARRASNALSSRGQVRAETWPVS